MNLSPAVLRYLKGNRKILSKKIGHKIVVSPKIVLILSQDVCEFGPRSSSSISSWPATRVIQCCRRRVCALTGVLRLSVYRRRSCEPGIVCTHLSDYILHLRHSSVYHVCRLQRHHRTTHDLPRPVSSPSLSVLLKS